MKITAIVTKYIFNRNGKAIELAPIPNRTNEQVLQHYATIYPELTNATVKPCGIKNGANLVEFNTIAGTKG